MVYLKVDQLLKEKNISGYRLAYKMDVAHTTIYKLINNDVVSMHFETLEKLCKALDCTPNDIFEITDDIEDIKK